MNIWFKCKKYIKSVVFWSPETVVFALPLLPSNTLSLVFQFLALDLYHINSSRDLGKVWVRLRVEIVPVDDSVRRSGLPTLDEERITPANRHNRVWIVEVPFRPSLKRFEKKKMYEWYESCVKVKLKEFLKPFEYRKNGFAVHLRRNFNAAHIQECRRQVDIQDDVRNPENETNHQLKYQTQDHLDE